MNPLWSSSAIVPGMHAGFRGTFTLAADQSIELRTLGANWFSVHVDGQWLLDGPERFHRDHPRWRSTSVTLTRGRHVIAVHACHTGADTRLLRNSPPFIDVCAMNDAHALPISWRCLVLSGYSTHRRINPQLGWSEWCDTRQVPAEWQALDFDDRAWTEPISIDSGLGPAIQETCPPVRCDRRVLQTLAHGSLAEVFGYDIDDPPVRFLMRDLDDRRFPAQGRWWRFDLGRIRLGRPRVKIEAAPGTVVELGYAERLDNGRVVPLISLSCGTSCNLDHYRARGGLQEFAPLEPRGGRFLEVHVLGEGHLIEATWDERGWFDEPHGSFTCGDPLLERIWAVGVDTVRACAEDALIDTPIRERGQRTGDVVPAMEVIAVAWNDLALVRRALVQAAEDVTANGLVAGLCPANALDVTTYALQWVAGCVRYVELCGDHSLLEELLPAAERTLAVFAAAEGPDGVDDRLGWGFVDWSYVRPPGPCDPAVDVFLARARAALARWQRLLGRDGSVAEEGGQRCRARLRGRLDGAGYHLTALGLADGLLIDPEVGAAALRQHLRNCFPHDVNAPRLADPSAAQPRMITPYFAHWALPGLLAHGDAAFVLDEYRLAWGWALDQGLTTWPEVFDLRWSHCHAWSGCPTWQLTRHLLGLQPRQDLGPGHCRLAVGRNPLNQAAGRVPFAGGAVDIEWTRTGSNLAYRLRADRELVIDGRPLRAGQLLEVDLPGA